MEMENAAEAIWIVIPTVLYFTILLTLSYSVRRKMPFILGIIGIFLMASFFTIGISYGINRAEAIQPVFRPASAAYTGPGLILSRSDIDIVLLRESNDLLGPRIVSIPGQSLIYQEVPLGPNNTILSLPPLSFGSEMPWFFQSIAMDFSLTANELKIRFEENFIYFLAYVFSLVLFLASFRFILDLTQWPLANLFFGAVIFRLILSMETFLNAREINALLVSILSGFLPSMLITPFIFYIFAFLIVIYTLLVHLARSRRDSNA